MIDAIVIKNFIPFSSKVQMLHKDFGKIVCIYPKGHIAQQLTTGSAIVCDVESMGNMYRFISLDTLYKIKDGDIEQLYFIHDIMTICMKLIPDRVEVPEIFNFLISVYGQLDSISAVGRKIVIIRLFLYCEILPSTADVYRLAMQNPHGSVIVQESLIDQYIKYGFHEMKKLCV